MNAMQSRRVVFAGFILAALGWAQDSRAADAFSAERGPHTITGGEDALMCDWPSVVALRNGGGDVFCTGSIVHPRVVLTAAHCIASQTPIDVAFGNLGNAPDGAVGVDFCSGHPTYDGEDGTEGYDVAYCLLSQNVEVPIVPPLMGCEADALQPGVEVAIVGYGATQANLGNDGWEDVAGVGTKRLTTQTLEQVSLETLFLLGGGSSACPGDSGGPAALRLEDGSWRMLGAGSRLHPDSPTDQQNDCGYGALYSTFAHVMPWIEDGVGYDITPCHDADGTWNPDERCGAFPLAPDDGSQSSGSWASGCSTEALSGWSATCGAPFGDDPGGTTSTGGESGSAETSTGSVDPDDSGGGDDTSSGGPLSGGTAADDTGSDTGSGVEPDPTPDLDDAEDSSGSSGGVLAQGDGDDGCGCRSGPGGGWQALFGLGLLGLLRRRR